MDRCPGQDTRFWDEDAIYEVKCPKCGTDVEFFQDDVSRRCGQCNHKFVNPRLDFGCAAYCQYAEQCLGGMSAELMAKRQDLLKDRVALEMKKFFRTDFRRIGHAIKVARYAEEIGKKEGGDLAVILAAAYLHDIGMPDAVWKYDISASELHGREGVPITRGILEKLMAPKELIDEVCDIVGHHHHPREEETINFKSVYDADLIVNFSEAEYSLPKESDQATAWIDEKFLTKSGRALAKLIFVPEMKEKKNDSKA